MTDRNVLERILMGHEEPRDLALPLLEEITENFSERRKIGVGGFGVVYKGELQNGIVAVKRIIVSEQNVDDVAFRREVDNLMKIISHRNVVRFLGFCSVGQYKIIKETGSTKNIWAEQRERLLCFNYISNGSLNKHITDELRGLDWSTRYDIISGICRGLHYLHEEKNIIHMDLNPSNIMLDNDMVPMITDFGLSRLDKNTHTSGTRFVTRGYCAPEYEEDGQTSKLADMYSLGVIIVELVTGHRGLPNNHNVLRRWRHRWHKEAPALLNYQEHQLTKCMEIAVRCRKNNPKYRPSIGHILHVLHEIERDKVHIGQESTDLDDDMLGIEPLELHFTSELNKEMSCSVKLTNRTKACFTFNIEKPSKQYTIRPDKGIVTPGCNEYLVQITVQPQERAPQVTQNADKLVVLSTKVSEGLRVEDITEHIFHEQTGKVVDEVDLMVVYEPMKPQENCKSREDTNMPDEEVPEVKNRKIVGSASRKGILVRCKNVKVSLVRYKDINSSTRGHCTEQTEQCKFYPSQSFSHHYPTNTTYLGKGSRAVDVARGAMGSLLDKLGKLVKEDYNLERSMKRDIESFSEDLAKIHKDLPHLEKLDGVEIWVDEVRELSYNIEDIVDSFVVHVEPNSSRSGFRELPHEGLKFLENDMTTDRQIGDVIRDIKNKVQAVADRQKKYNFSVNNVVADPTTKAPIEPQMAIYINKKQLVGIEARTDELIRLFEEDGDVSKQELKIVSIVGLGGLGKTTLARAVYDKLKAQYNSRAFVSVGQNPDVKKVLMNILFASRKKASASNLDLEVQQLIDELQEFLEDERYLIVIDDIWDSETWGHIQSAFPENKHGSRVITTTRIHHVALATCNSESKYVYKMKPLSDEDSRKLFLRRIFGSGKDCPDAQKEISTDILKRCGGMPLAINSIASLLAGEPKSTWDYIRKTLGAMTEGDDLEKMKQILDLSYIHLPDHLKTCLLYVCMYPEDREIAKNDLLSQWVAEGFVHVSTNGRLDAVDVAEKYFKELINMCMIQPEKIDDYNNEVLSCRVHGIILDLLRSKSSKENFIHVIDGSKDEIGALGEIRRVSLHYNGKEHSTILESIKGSLSHVRSVLFCRSSLVPYFMEFKYVRVLHLEHRYSSRNNHLDLTGISRLFLLRYLKVVAGFGIELKLPNQIGELQQLEMVDIHGCELRNYPSDIVSLPWLSHLSLKRLVLPDGIDRLKSLRTLEGVDVLKSSVENIKGLGKLTNLRKLQIFSNDTSEWVEETTMYALYSSICKLSANLRTFTFTGVFMVYIPDVPGWITRTPFPLGSHIQKLDLSGCEFDRCPEWIDHLHGLYKLCISVREVADGVSIVARLPSLAYFCLSIAAEQKEESVVIPGTSSGAFKALKHLMFFCKKASLTFEAGAMPRLENLDIEFRHKMAPRFLPVGIQHLPAGTLKQICLRVDYNNDRRVKDSNPILRAYEDYSRKHTRKLGPMLKRAFKQHHPDADIIIWVGMDKYIGDDGRRKKFRALRMKKED